MAPFPSNSCLPLVFICSLFLPTIAFPSRPDYLIIGAGTSGCALAARLCVLRPDRSIVLLERSRPRNVSQEFLVRSPRQMYRSWFNEDLVDAFPSLPNSALQNRSLFLFDGNTLGGTSSINGMQFSLPVTGTVEKWRIRGLTTENSKKYYQRAIDQVGIAIPEGNLRHMYVREYIEAAKKVGFSEIKDALNDSNSRIIFENFLAVDENGFRRDACTAYLSPVIDGKCKRNLRLVQDATVKKILLSKSKPRRAFGVEYVRSNDKDVLNPKRMMARKEVISCAGPFGSPKLLQLSGIGPPKVLRKAGVKVRVALPVGRRCRARAVIAVDSDYSGVPLEPSMNSTLVFSEEALKMFSRGDGGVLGIPATFANGKDKGNGFISANANTFPAFVDRSAMNAACINNVNSFGYLRIKDKNPFSGPEVQSRILQSKADLKRAMRCVKRLVDIFKEFPPRFKMSIANPVGGDVTEKWVREMAVWNGHFIGGCRVGDVLRRDLSVRKTRQLRVVDSSSLRKMPVSAGPMGSVYMIAEYMAEIIAGVQGDRNEG